jgi:hypothetical protein
VTLLRTGSGALQSKNKYGVISSPTSRYITLHYITVHYMYAMGEQGGHGADCRQAHGTGKEPGVQYSTYSVLVTNRHCQALMTYSRYGVHKVLY